MVNGGGVAGDCARAWSVVSSFRLWLQSFVNSTPDAAWYGLLATC